MQTPSQEYFDWLYKIRDANAPTTALLIPNDEKIYNVNLNSREIDSPEFLSVQLDHQAETIYFVVDRFYDGFDLSNASCVIHYITADNKAGIYAVPFYDIITFKSENKMVFPWCIEGPVTETAGDVTYAIRFFMTTNGWDEDRNEAIGDIKFVFNLNTLSTKSKVLYGIPGADKLANEAEKLSSELLDRFNQFSDILHQINTGEKRLDVYWIDI